MLVCPHEMLQNHPNRIEGAKVQGKSCQGAGRLLRVAASSNESLGADTQLQEATARPALRAGQLQRWASLSGAR